MKLTKKKNFYMKRIISVFLLFAVIVSIFIPAYMIGASETTYALNSDLWSDVGNFDSNWEGLTNYQNTTEFIITDAADLAAFIISINKNKQNTYENKTVILANDIDLSMHLWDMRGGIPQSGGNGNVFSGIFDANNHTISNMHVDYDNNYIGNGSDFGGFGLFACLYKAKIKNLTIQDSSMNIGYFVASFPFGAGFVAGQSSGSTFENVNVNNGTITQKYNHQGTTGYIFFGGIVGTHYQPFTRLSPASLPSTYTNCNVDGLKIDYTERIDQNWQLILGFGGIVGGDSTYNPDKINPYQTSITDCHVNNFTVTRGPNIETAFCYEGYGGVIGYMDQPTLIKNTHVTNLLIDISHAATKNGATFGIVGPASAMAGGIVGYGETNPNLRGFYQIEESSVQGTIKANANPDLFPVYIGGLMGRNEGKINCLDNYTELDLTNLKSNKNQQLIYGNLFGYLGDNTIVNNNIFNNYDYLADESEKDLPSTGYLGQKLSTFAATGELDNKSIDLSQNWGILKFILTESMKDYPLEYQQCEEKTREIDFYDFWQIDAYTHEYLSQDIDTQQVTFNRNSGENTFLMNSQISSKNGKPTWLFTKDIIVLPNATPSYSVTYLPGTQGVFTPQYYDNLKLGEITPSFIGVPNGNSGWTFSGWSPLITNIITGDAIYTALWESQPQTLSSLLISKTVTGNDGEMNRDFNFKITFDNEELFNYTGSKAGSIKSGDIITLQHEQSITIQNIPIGTHYSIIELEANQEGYTTTATNNMGVIKDTKNTASFINHRENSLLTNNLTISKIVTGNGGEINRDFNFRITFDNNETFHYTGSKVGLIKSGDIITLQHEQSITIQNIPIGTHYSIIELEANQEGYTTTVTGDSGNINNDENKVIFTNYKNISNSVQTPETGDTNHVLIVLINIVLLSISLIIMIVIKQRMISNKIKR